MERKSEAKLNAPISVSFETTRKCNFECLYCDVTGGTPRANELTTAEVKNIIEEIAELKVFFFYFSGGEPLLREDIFDLVAFAKQIIPFVALSTNGVFLDERCVDFLKEVEINTVMVSIDGASAESFAIFRGDKSLFHKVLEGVRRLREADIPVIVNTVMTQLNYRELDSLIDLAVRLRVNQYRAVRVRPTGRARTNFERLSMDSEQYRQSYLRLLEKGIVLKDVIEIATHDPLFSAFPESPKLLKQKLDESSIPVCSAAKSYCFIRSDGVVLPCENLDTFVAGDVRKSKLGEIWRQSRIFKELRRLTVKQLVGKCRSCVYNIRCCGGCRASTYYRTGTFLAADPDCWVNVT